MALRAERERVARKAAEARAESEKETELARQMETAKAERNQAEKFS